MLKKTLAIVVGMLMWTTAITTTAGAEGPEVIEDSFTFVDVNPCTGHPHEITISFVARLHEHQNNFVATLSRSGSTSDGYTMQNGNDGFVENRGGARGHLMDMWTDGHGSKFQARGTFAFNANKDAIVVDRFTLRCVKA